MMMTTLTYDQLFETILGMCASFIVIASLWIVYILIQIEQNKAAFYSIDTENDDGIHSSLDLEVEEDPNSPTKQQQPQSPESKKEPQVVKKTRHRRIRASFTIVQFLSVGVLVLLTYLLLVTSNAPMWLSAVGSLCVFGVFLRFQIGDEIRRQRWDRLTLLLSLFMLIASLLSMSVYAMKSLKQGEVYEGPARIVAYDANQYNNTDHDPSRRTDLFVQWGEAWGCPLSGSKVCQAQVQGAMCQVNTDADGDRRRRRVQDEAAAQDGEADAQDTEALEEENQTLEQENEELEEKIEELEQENTEEKEEAEVEVEVVEEDEKAEEAEADAEIVEEEAYEYEDAEIYDEEIYGMEEEVLDEEAENTSNSQDAETYKEEEKEYETLEGEVEDEYDEYVDELEDEVESFEESEEEHEETEEELKDEESNSTTEEEGEVDEIEEETEEEEEETYEEEEEELYEEEEEEMYEEEESGDDEWYWDEVTIEYDDDYYESEYWDYDWDSVWGEYACEDLFDTDRSGKTYDGSTPAGGDDDWPFINIYGSCKTCEAYILDYFAEEAFERVDDYKKQSILFMTAAIAGFLVSLIGFIKYKIAPPAENEIQLLGSDGGVVA